jgi:hypothetical protein
LIVFQDEFHGAVLAADVQPVLQHSLDAFQHPRRGHAEIRARAGHAGDIADLQLGRIRARDADQRKSRRRGAGGPGHAQYFTPAFAVPARIPILRAVAHLILPASASPFAGFWIFIDHVHN